MPIYTNALAQRPANMLAYQDTLSATPRNEYLGALADLIAQSYSPQRTQQMQGTARFLSLPAISQTLDRLSYGEPLTTGAGGLGGTTRVRPEALEAAMAVAPAAKPATMASLQAAREARRAALAAGMAGERYAEKVVPQIMERGGLPAEMLQGMAQNTTSNMAERVGKLKAIEALFPGKTEAMLSPAEKSALTKYKQILDTPAVMRREQARLFGTGDIVQPSLNVAQEIGVHPNALLDKYVVPILWDTSATGGNVTQIAGVPLTQGLRDATPAFVQRQGGRRYPYIAENLQQGVGGASNETAQVSKINNLNKFSELGDTIGVQMNLAPSGINFSHHIAESYVGALNALKPSREALTSFRDAVRNVKSVDPVTKEVSYPYKKFPGLDSANIREIMANGVPGEYSAGNIRKAIGEVGSTAAMEKQGFPRWQDVYNVMSEPGAETGMAHTLLAVKPNTQMVTPNFKHGSYNAGLEAQVMGSLQNAQGQIVGVPDRLMMQKTFAKKIAEGKNINNIRTSLLKSHHGERLDQEAIDNIARYLGYQVD
jgi:hypothetical protein